MQIRPVIKYHPDQPLLLSNNLSRWNTKKRKKENRKEKSKKIYCISHKRSLKDLTTALKVKSNWKNVLVLHDMPNKNVTL